MANNENLKPVRTKNEARERGRNGGKKSGEVRRRKADFRKTLNLLLTAKIDVRNGHRCWRRLVWTAHWKVLCWPTQIKEAMNGNTKAAYFVAQYAGQSPEPEENIRNREADTELKRARKQAVTGENETDEALDKLDRILKEVRDNAIKQETE